MIQTYLLAQAGNPGNFMLPMMLAMFGLMYFVMWRPQRQQQKRQDEMRNNLSKGDKIVTVGGIHGMVSGVAKNTVTVKVTDGTSIKFDRVAIAQCLNDKPKEANDSDDSDDDTDED